MIVSCLVCVPFPFRLVIIGLYLHVFPFASTKAIKCVINLLMFFLRVCQQMSRIWFEMMYKNDPSLWKDFLEKITLCQWFWIFLLLPMSHKNSVLGSVKTQ